MAIIVASNYDLLPDASENDGKMAQVTNSTDDHHRGYYVSDGTSWVPASMRSDAIRAKLEEIEDAVAEMEAPTLEVSDIEGLQEALDGKQAAGSYAPASHNHDDRYYTEDEMNTALAGKQAAGSYATPTDVSNATSGLSAALTKLSGFKVKKMEAFSGSTDANGDITVNTSTSFVNPRAVAVPAGSSDGVGYSMKLISKSGTAITFRAYKTQTTAVLLLNTNVDPDIAAASTAVDILVVEPE